MPSRKSEDGVQGLERSFIVANSILGLPLFQYILGSMLDCTNIVYFNVVTFAMPS